MHRQVLFAEKEMRVLDALISNGYPLPDTSCGGMEKCGKCIIRVISGSFNEKSEREIRLLSAKKQNGDDMRLACMARFTGKAEIEYEIKHSMVICEEGISSGIDPEMTDDGRYAIASDLGTTTIAMALIDLSDGETVATESEMNMQKAFGADVISRIDVANKDIDKITDCVINQYSEMIRSLCRKAGVDVSKVKRLTVCGNTTMQHIFARTNPISLALAPFRPVFTETRTFQARELGLDFDSMEVVLLGSISAYVGADIVSGIYATDLLDENRISILLDLGTNGEIVLNNRGKLYCCSSAAGPVFEGSSIAYGTASIDGAISSVHYVDGELKYKTIGNRKPIGFCGSGVIDMTAAVLDMELADETGAMDDPCPIEGSDIAFVPKDVREVQLAKAAVYAGILTLLDYCHLEIGDVDKVFLAGGFGTYLDKESACKIGLLSTEWRDRIESVGNTSLVGAMEMITRKGAVEKMESLRQKAEYLELSNSPEFQDFYVEEMMFENYG